MYENTQDSTTTGYLSLGITYGLVSDDAPPVQAADSAGEKRKIIE
jgi:hypothetical protein